MATDEGYELIVPFLNGGEDFALGFEMGRLYSKLCVETEEFSESYHRKNDEQVLVMAARLGWHCEWVPAHGEWAQARFCHRRSDEDA